ncbi:MAG TPA: hypothetical protein P5159_00200 [Phycisphaerae bacterium]|nr:hypothetical protein [Phycisphaerae bacterium]HSA24920.1 hypothetical protein [Phycisphaerae bacterium]
MSTLFRMVRLSGYTSPGRTATAGHCIIVSSADPSFRLFDECGRKAGTARQAAF